MTEPTVMGVLDALTAISRGEGGAVPVADLRMLSNKDKPGGEEYDKTSTELEALAEDGPAARALVTKYLHTMGLGYKKSREQPLMASGILLWLVERIANLLDSPPSYFWRKASGAIEKDNAAAHKTSSELAEEMDLTSALRKLHRLAVTSGQAYLRVYPTEDGLLPRVFGASGVMRLVHPALADNVQHDRVFALPISGGQLEVHWQDGAGARFMVWCDAETGVVDPSSPFAAEGHATAYDLLPVVRLGSEPTVGAPYVAPRSSRVTYTLAISALQNDLLAMGALQAHSLLVWLQDLTDPNREDAHAQVPEPGPGAGYKLPKGDDLKFETPQPLIEAVLKIVLSLLKTFLLGEHVPQHEAEGDAVRTGQALLVAERGLLARSEAMRPGLVRAARDVWRVVRDVGMTDQVGPADLPPVDLVLQLAPQRMPATLREILEDLAKALALDLSSRVEAIQRLHGCSRDEAIARIEQIDADLAEYGKGSAKDEANTSGGGFTENLEATDGGTVDSVADAVRGRTAADARADRREDAPGGQAA